MRLRPDDVPHAVVVGAAGAVWGLGLARLLGEALLWSPAFSFPLVVGGLAFACSLAVLGLSKLSLPAFRPPSPMGSVLPTVPLALPLFYAVGRATRPLAGSTLLVGGALLTLLLIWQDRPRWLLPGLLGLVCLALYGRTLLPTVGEADTLEFQVIASKLGVAHPTGYPLYVLLGKLFTLLPVNSVAWRVNLSSAVFGAAAVLVLYVIVRLLTDLPLLSFLTALAFACSRTFWSQAVIAEVYTLHNLLVAVTLWLLMSQPGQGGRRKRGQARRWQAIFLLLGLSLTNHLTTALLVPAVALMLLWERPRLGVRGWLLGGGLLLLGLSPYLFVLLRWPALNEGEWMTLRDFVTYISGGQFHGALRLYGWRDPTRWQIVGRLLRQPFGWVGLGLGALGVVDLWRGRRRALTVTALTFLAFLVYALDYYVADVSVFLLPAHLILAAWMGAGAASLTRWLCSCSWATPEVWRAGVVVLFSLVPLTRIWVNLPDVDRSRERGREAWGRYVLSRPLPKRSAILVDTKKFAPLYYLQQVEGVRPDLDIVLLGSEELYQRELRRRLDQGQTVYLARFLPHLEGLHLRSVGPLAEVRKEVAVGDPSPSSGLASFGERIRLLEARVTEDPLGRPLYHLTLSWRAQRAVGEDLVVRLRLVDARGEVRWASDGARPVNGLYPSTAWLVDVIISDYYEVPIMPWVVPGTYSLEMGLFLPFSDEGLKIDESLTSWLKLKRLQVEPPSSPQALSESTRHRFSNGVWLTGHDLVGETTSSASVTVDLSWRNVDHEEQVVLSWADADGRQVEREAFPLAAGVVRSRQVVTSPSKPGVYQLRVGLKDEVALCDWLAPVTDACSLGRIGVRRGRDRLSNFGDRILLLYALVGKTEAAPGEDIPVDLRWRALRSMDDDYTVFVHLVGPDGRLHGQVDSWPVQGSYPTSQMEPGEEVTDRYEVRLDPDAPAGQYRVVVGWYLLDTMERLQVLDDAGRSTTDALAVGAFSVPESTGEPSSKRDGAADS